MVIKDVGMLARNVSKLMKTGHGQRPDAKPDKKMFSKD